MATSALGRRGGMSLGYLAWYYAHPAYVLIDGDGLVQQWSDRGPGAYNLTKDALNRPTWEASGGWSASKSSILFPGAKDIGTTGALGTFFNGSDMPYWVAVTGEITSLATERTIVAWDNAGSVESRCTLTATDGFAQFTRVDDGAGSASATATGGGVTINTHRRMGWSFAGTTVSAWVDSTKVLNGAACNVGTCTFSQFRIGEGLGGPNSLVGRLTEVVIGVGVLTDSDWAKYYQYSVAEWA